MSGGEREGEEEMYRVREGGRKKCTREEEVSIIGGEEEEEEECAERVGSHRFRSLAKEKANSVRFHGITEVGMLCQQCNR